MRTASVSALSPAVNKIWKTCEMVRLFQNWPLAMMDRFHLVDRRPLLYSLRNGVKLHAHAGSLVRFINEIWIDKVYTPPPAFTIRDGWVIVDLGGHEGVFSLLAATSARGVSVYAFEPSPSSYRNLCRNIELNALTNVKTFEVAVSSADGEALLHVAHEAGRTSLVQRSDVTLQAKIPVQAWSLERVLKVIGSHVNLLKMDIEGMEYEVILSCPREALRRVERIALEYHGESLGRPRFHGRISELVDLLTDMDFSVDVRPEHRILLAQRNPRCS